MSLDWTRGRSLRAAPLMLLLLVGCDLFGGQKPPVQDGGFGAAGDCAADPHEPNDDVASAVLLSEVSEGTLCAGDVDFWRVDVAAGERLTLTASGEDLGLSAFDPEGGPLEPAAIVSGDTLSWDNRTAATRSLVVRVSSGAPGVVYRLTTVGASGTWDTGLAADSAVGGDTGSSTDTADTSDTAGAADTSQGGAVVDTTDTGPLPSVCPDDSFEDNDDLASSTVLPSPGAPTVWPGLRSCDNDWYTVALPSGASLDVVIDFAHADGNLNLDLRNGAGGLLVRSSSQTDRERVRYTNSSSATLTMQVLVFLSGSDPGLPGNDYDLSVSVTP